MPTIRNQETVDLIAQNYCSNGHNKEKALKTVGYSDSYAETLGHTKVYGNIRVKEAISKIEAKNKAKIEHNYQIAISELNQVIANLKPKAESGDTQANQALTQAIREKNAIAGLHKQEIKHTTDDQQRKLNAKEQAEAKRLASIRLRQGTG